MGRVIPSYFFIISSYFFICALDYGNSTKVTRSNQQKRTYTTSSKGIFLLIPACHLSRVSVALDTLFPSYLFIFLPIFHNNLHNFFVFSSYSWDLKKFRSLLLYRPWDLKKIRSLLPCMGAGIWKKYELYHLWTWNNHISIAGTWTEIIFSYVVHFQNIFHIPQIFPSLSLTDNRVEGSGYRKISSLPRPMRKFFPSPVFYTYPG